MYSTTEITPVTLLAAYAQGRKDGFVAGITIGVGTLIFVRSYRYGRDSKNQAKRLFNKN